MRGGKERTVRTSVRIFFYSIWSGFDNIPASGTLADGNWELDTGDMGFLKVPDFLWRNYIHYNYFISKKLFKLDVSIHVPNICLHLRTLKFPKLFLATQMKTFWFAPCMVSHAIIYQLNNIKKKLYM